jgi:hypothetical protein
MIESDHQRPLRAARMAIWLLEGFHLNTQDKRGFQH